MQKLCRTMRGLAQKAHAQAKHGTRNERRYASELASYFAGLADPNRPASELRAPLPPHATLKLRPVAEHAAA
jgi:hypothetical protein